MVDECCCKDNFKAVIWLETETENIIVRTGIINYIKEKYNIISKVYKDNILLNNKSNIFFAVDGIGTLRCRVNAIAYKSTIKGIVVQQIILPSINYYFNNKKYFCLEPTMDNIYVIDDILKEG